MVDELGNWEEWRDLLVAHRYLGPVTCDRILGLATDLGHASAHVIEHLKQCNALLLESNHDPQLLAASNYPDFLKRRIAGHLGHLSNEAAGQLARTL